MEKRTLIFKIRKRQISSSQNEAGGLVKFDANRRDCSQEG